MSIGSAAEIGVKFYTGPEALQDWLNGGSAKWREEVTHTLLGGYATVHYVQDECQDRMRRINEYWNMIGYRPYVDRGTSHVNVD